ncbi:Pectate lyase superfamily protein [uncultured Caudovirales phage]|uniref:Pectate lyase superfamily protein n=1 Tax=uncultured Caudovirales phage TaxID=2100421 RepID=A0A6J5LJV5_9CAUD|nr:Pectate lyase superfamily protein [uncultured Caudovirales phage]
MAVTQISRIQHRRGLEQDIPQLASAELGWSVDTQKLYIGNGTLEEGAPQTGITEILTTHSITNIASLLGTYGFVGDESGYTSQTGSSTINPTTRSYQHKLDDFVNVRDFGARGNGVDDDTLAINRAIQEIYKTNYFENNQLARRTIYFPGGVYIVTNTIYIPPYTRLVGDGISSSTIKNTMGNHSVISFCDSLYQTGTSIGTNSAVLPMDIEIYGLMFHNSNASIQQPIFTIDSASNVILRNTHLKGNVGAGFYPNLVNISSTYSDVKNVTFDNCKFTSASNAISIIGSATGVRVSSSLFDVISNAAVILGAVDGFLGSGNYYGSIGAIFNRISNTNNADVDIGSYYSTLNSSLSGINLSGLLISTGKKATLSATPTEVPILTVNSAVELNYDISNTTARRYGTLSFNTNGTQALFNDEYVETSTSVAANVYVTPSAVVFTIDSGVATVKFNYKTFQ